MTGKSIPPIKRILPKIKINEVTGCWEFTGAVIISRGGYKYGIIEINYKHILVHRYMYWFSNLNDKNQKLDKKICVCHKCDNTICCNPSHLFLGTNKDNSVDASRKGRLQRGERHTGSKLTEKQVLEIYKMKGTLKTIANKYKVNPHTIFDIKNRKTWKWLTKNITPIIENHNIKLTNEQVLEIYVTKGTCKVVGRNFGISPQAVSSIRNGTSWSWLTKGKRK